MHEMYERGGQVNQEECVACAKILILDKGQQTKMNMHNDGLLVKKYGETIINT